MVWLYGHVSFLSCRVTTLNHDTFYCRSLKVATGKENRPGKIPDQCCVCERRLGILNIGHKNQSCELCSKHVCRQCFRENLCSYCHVLRFEL